MVKSIGKYHYNDLKIVSRGYVFMPMRLSRIVFQLINTYKKKLNLRQKFSISAGLVIFVCFAIFTLYLLIDQNLRNKQILLKNSKKYSELLVLSNTEYLWNYDEEGLRKASAAFYELPEIAQIKITDNNGSILLNLNDKKVNSLELPIKTEIFKNNLKIGEIELVATSDEYKRTVFIIILKLIGLFAVIFSITLQSIRIISARVLKPLNEMLVVVDKISHGDMTNSITVVSDDEIGILAEDFNNMMYTVKESIDSVKSIIEFMPSIIIQLDLEGRVLEWNRLAEKLTGQNIDEAKNKYLKDIKPELSSYLWNIKNIIESDKPFSLYRIKIIGYDDKLFNIFIFPLKTNTKKTIVLRIDDISELEKKDEQIRQSQKLESIGLLAGGIAHDFNNILGGIIGTVSLLRYRIAKGKVDTLAQFDKDLALVENSCENGAGLVSQLLSLSRKQIGFEIHHLDLNEVMLNVANVCMKSFDKSISFTIKEYHEKAYAMINGPQIQQSLLNLCINASHSMTIMRKESEQQGGVLEIGITKIFADRFFLDSHPESAEGMYWRLYIRDTGVGMDSSTISKIYDPFFTTKTKTSVKGTGLGLSVVYSVIRAHKGFIDVYSEEGTGTLFSVYIPVSESDESFSETEIPVVCTGEGTILVIEDEEVIRNYAMAMLEECGYKVLIAENGITGLSMYNERKTQINAVLCDMMMPEKSGYETLVELKQINPSLPVLMTSGLYSNELIDNVKKAGADDFIEKPYSLVQLSQKIKSILKK